MKTIENVSRRTFLKAFGISSSALVLSVNLPGMSLIPKALAAGNATKFEPSVYVHINADNTVGIVVHRSEMGQGIRTSIPMIVADELEADWQSINVIQGLGDKKYGSQNTDGSRSVRNFYQPLREAGATARTMLEQAAAKVWQVPADECAAKQGRVYHSKSNQSLSFGELVSVAATLPLPDKSTIKLKSKDKFNFIGKSDVALVDGKDIATGNTVYGNDVDLPDLHVAVIARPPVLAAKVKSYDASKAKKIPGVIDVIQLDDVEEPVVFKPLGGIAVIAKNTWAALKAREALSIEWQDNEHAKYNSAEYKQALAESCDNADTVLRNKGDTTAALTQADQIIEAEYYVPELIHVPMEPPAATAIFEDGKVELWACTQTPQSAQNTVAQVLGIAPELVKVNVTLLGGGFGRKSKPDFIAEAALLSKITKKPIRVQWTREDEIKNGYYHAVSYQKLKAGIRNGNVDSWQHHVACPPIGSTFNNKADVISFESNLGLIDMPYDFSNIRCAAGRAKAHTRIGWLRSVTNINQAFAVSSFMDELAHKQGKEPKQFLLDSLGDDRHIDLTKEQAQYGNYGADIMDYPIDTARFKQLLNRVADNANWSKPNANNRAKGIAIHRSFVSYVACVAEVEKQPSGKIKVTDVWMCADVGTAINPERIHAQMEGAAIFGMSLALYGEITAKDGVIEQNNFNDYPLIRMSECPNIHVDIVESTAPPGGVGEPGVPPVAPAICNAIYALTGERYRELPLNKFNLI